MHDICTARKAIPPMPNNGIPLRRERKRWTREGMESLVSVLKTRNGPMNFMLGDDRET